MIVNYKTILNGDIFEDNDLISQFSRPDDVHKYVVLDVQFCCKEMEGQWNESIGFGEWMEYPPEQNTSVNIYYHYGSSIDSVPIKFCPFCREQITTIEKERTKLIKYTRTRKVKKIYHKEVKVQ